MRSSIIDGTTVSGNEGNGTVQFGGQYTQIVWANTVNENWYGFNVGIAQSVPEASQMVTFGLGLGVVMLGIGRTKRSPSA